MKAINIILSLIFSVLFSFGAASAMGNAAWTPVILVGSIILQTGMPTGVLMNVINLAQLSFNGREIMSISEAVIESIFEKPELNKIHRIVKGIVAKEQIVLLGRMGLVGKKAVNCKTPDSGVTIPTSEKFWDPEGVETRIVQCYKDLEKSFFTWGLDKGVKRPDLTAGDFANFIEERLDDALMEAIYRIAWFGDRDIQGPGGSPVGLLNDDAKVPFFDLIDGLWKQIFSIATTNPKQRVIIPENDEALEVDQLNLPANRALLVLRELKQKADKRLKGHKNKVYIWTDTLQDNLETFLETQNVNSSFERIEKGHGESLRYNDIPIIKLDITDRIIAEHFDNGVKLDKPHRAILTTIDNIPLGIEEESALSDLDIFHERKDKELIVDSLFKLDAKVIEDFMIQAAF